jgi:endonuclease/exonuclease/phosphatase family metal-dependent hydrolase
MMTRLIFYNIEYLEGIDGKKMAYLEFWKRIVHPHGIDIKIADALREYDPDIVAFAEVGGKNFVEGDYFKNIQKELGLKHHVKRMKYDFRGKFNLLKDVPFLNKQANAIMSKKKLSEIETFYLHEGIKRTVIKVDVDCGRKVALFIVHLALGKETRKKQIEELIGIVKKIKTPVILAGDFNTFGGEKEIKRLLEQTSLRHKFKVHGGRIFTFPSYHPRRRFDYILTSKDIRVKKYSVLKMPFSDHLPVMVDFEVRK